MLANGPGSGLQTVYFEDFEDLEAFNAWTITKGPGPHTCGPFLRIDDATHQPSGGADYFLLADNECITTPPLTSCKADSPEIDMTIPGVHAVILEADLRFDANFGEDLTVEAWDGSQWVVVWSDTNVDIDTTISVDVSAQALGNAGFRVRFNYQNADTDRFVSIDDVTIIADVSASCATEASGPFPAAAGSLRTDRPGGATDAIDVTWGTACGAIDYNLLYGDLDGVASYALLGSECSLGTTGSYSWTGVPAGNLYLLVVGTDGSTESSWGRDSGFAERNGAAASNLCGVSVKDPTGTCN